MHFPFSRDSGTETCQKTVSKAFYLPRYQIKQLGSKLSSERLPYKLLKMLEYRKSSIKPPGGLFNFGPSRGGFNREGGFLERGAYSQNQAKRIYLVAFQFLYSIFCGFNTQFSGSNYNSTQFLSQIILKSTCKVV